MLNPKRGDTPQHREGVWAFLLGAALWHLAGRSAPTSATSSDVDAIPGPKGRPLAGSPHCETHTPLVECASHLWNRADGDLELTQQSYDSLSLAHPSHPPNTQVHVALGPP